MNFFNPGIRSSIYAWTVILLSLFFLPAHAQTNDLMIVEYVDWNPGDGFAVEIYNPTGSPVLLSNYYLKIYNNGNLTASSSTQLSGTLAPCGTIRVGNFSDCALTINANVSGVNGDDVVALTLGNTTNFVDMVGLYGGGGPAKVNNVSNALKWNRLIRNPGNTIRYTSSNGTSANSWPSLANVNVTGWTVTGVSCISPGHTLSALTFSLGNDTTICNGNSLTLDAGIPGATYLWSTGATTRTIQVTASGAYAVQVNNGCATGTASRNVLIQPGAQVNAGPDLLRACKSTLPVLINGSVAANNFAVKWSGGKGSFLDPKALNTTYTPAPQDPYRIKLTLTATSACGSQSDELIFINGDSTLLATGLDFSPQNPKVGDTITFFIQTPSASNMLIGTFDFGDKSPTQIKRMQAKHVYSAEGEFQVKVAPLSLTGCPLDTLTTSVRIAPFIPATIFIPNVFTPNSDGRNDTFAPQLPATRSYNVRIYNRWGGLVFSSNEQGKDWDGKNVSDGVYFAHITAILATGEVIERKLPITLIR